METIKASHITQIRTYLRIDPRDIRNERTTHLCHNNVAIKHSATMAQIGKFAAAAASVIWVASLRATKPFTAKRQRRRQQRWRHYGLFYHLLGAIVMGICGGPCNPSYCDGRI